MKGKIFNAQEVQAIMSGSKVQFREVIKKPLKHFEGLKVSREGFLGGYNKLSGWYEEISNVRCPYKIGRKIFCKESFFEDLIYRKFVGYETENNLSDINARTIKINARYMKQEHSRLTLEITGIRVERLGEISYEDCLKEGIEKVHGYHNSTFPEKYDYVFKDYTSGGDYITHNPRKSFWTLWNATHKKPEEKFEASPLVWVFSCEVVK